MTSRLRFLVVPLAALFAVGAALAGPHGAPVPATRHAAPASAAAWTVGSPDQAVLPLHSFRDSNRFQRPAGLAPPAPPRLLPRWIVARAVVPPVPAAPAAALLGTAPRAPPAFA